MMSQMILKRGEMCFFNLLDEDTVISHATDIAMRIREKKYKY